MLEELVARVFSVRNAAHLAHWRAKGAGSFARHMALGDFYDGAIDKIDGIVEAMQGATGSLIGTVKLADTDSKSDIIPRLVDDVNWIAKNRENIAKRVPAIENLLDDLADLYLSTIYKLKNLS
jgi:DNA-binding ferritin-like protein